VSDQSQPEKQSQ